ncbi:MAG TPA: type II CAAX endopeptidase family protein [Verrucomicrobiae bacterium]|nr:type II CAAX endopeptidase family protein [Verrucomicrobiae bacterium]
MKKCPYCGKEYSDDVERCLIDDEVLLGGKAEINQDSKEITEPEPAVTPSSKPKIIWSEQNIRIFEIVLICTIAFGGSILSSIYSYLGNNFDSSPNSSWVVWDWTIRTLREASALGLLWYILMRRGKSFSDLGLSWAWKDVGWAIILRAGGSLAFYAVYDAIYYTGLTSISHKVAHAHIDNILFGSGVSFATLMFQFVNPFFEELIVRAYLMTEIKQLTNSATKAIIISTVLQTSYHLYQSGPVALAHGATFLIWAVFYAKTNRIAPIILAHLYSDVSATLWYMLRQ